MIVMLIVVEFTRVAIQQYLLHKMRCRKPLKKIIVFITNQKIEKNIFCFVLFYGFMLLEHRLKIKVNKNQLLEYVH